MSDNTTRPSAASPAAFLATVEHPGRKRDGEVLLDLMRDATGQEPVMWGASIVGYGSYHYRYESGREGDFLCVGFSPRKQNLALYGLRGAPESGPLLSNLGKHKVGVSCLYVNKLDDVDVGVLRELVAAAYRWRCGRDAPG
jgi:hypothetical protein